MIVAVVILGVVALVALVVALTSWRRARTTARQLADSRGELTAAATRLDEITTERDAVRTELATIRAERDATLAERDAADQARVVAESERDAAGTARDDAQRRAAELAAAAVDADVLWILEQARSERTWRFSVAPHPDSPSALDGASNPLLAAIQIEIDAAREDVGAVVELDADVPDGLTVPATILALRAAQELVADVVRRSEETVVRVHGDGAALVVDVVATDEAGEPVLPAPLGIASSPSIAETATGVRVLDAFTPPT